MAAGELPSRSDPLRRRRRRSTQPLEHAQGPPCVRLVSTRLVRAAASSPFGVCIFAGYTAKFVIRSGNPTGPEKFLGEHMNKAQRRAHVESPCPQCGARVIPIWKDERSAADDQPDWHVSARQCSSRICTLNNAHNWQSAHSGLTGGPLPRALPGPAARDGRR